VVEHHHVKRVAVGDQQGPAVGGAVDRFVGDLDPAKAHARIGPQHLVMVARDQYHPGAAMRQLEQAADHLVVRVRPVPAFLEPPAVDDVADQIERLALDCVEEVEQQRRVAAARAEVDVTDPDRAVPALWPKPARFGLGPGQPVGQGTGPRIPRQAGEQIRFGLATRHVGPLAWLVHASACGPRRLRLCGSVAVL
jgi:hypothetical protein